MISITGFVTLGCTAMLFTESKVCVCRYCGQEMHAYYDYHPRCGEQEPIVEVAAVKEWGTADLPDPGASVVASEYSDHVIVYEEDHEQAGIVSPVWEIDAETRRTMHEDAEWRF